MRPIRRTSPLKAAAIGYPRNPINSRMLVSNPSDRPVDAAMIQKGCLWRRGLTREARPEQGWPHDDWPGPRDALSEMSAQRTAHAAERMAVYRLDAPMVGVAWGPIQKAAMVEKGWR